jgi:hypothetical protein
MKEGRPISPQDASQLPGQAPIHPRSSFEDVDGKSLAPQFLAEGAEFVETDEVKVKALLKSPYETSDEDFRAADAEAMQQLTDNGPSL